MNAEPLVRVVRGEPDAEELAALVTVLAARSASVDAKPRPRSTSAWIISARPSMGATTWRGSALPR